MGLIDPFAEHRAKPLADHLADYGNFLLDKDSSEGHVHQTVAQIKVIVAGCKFATIPDLSAARVAQHLAELRQAGASASTSNHYLRRIKSFSRWLLQDRRRTNDDVLRHLSAINVATNRRHCRKALSPEEFGRLVDAARDGEPFRDLDGQDRAVLYTVAAYTGLRVGELASLTPESFYLDGSPPTVMVWRPTRNAGGRTSCPCTRTWWPCCVSNLAGVPEGQRLWPGTWRERASRMIKVDLAAAGIPYDDGGKVFDFHSLHVTALGRAGVPLLTMQKLARHSTPTLTANVYSLLALVDLAGAVNDLPTLISQPSATFVQTA